MDDNLASKFKNKQFLVLNTDPTAPTEIKQMTITLLLIITAWYMCAYI